MKNSLAKSAKKPCIYTENNIVYKVSKEFLQLTGYKDNVLIGKSLMDVSILLRIESQMPIQDIEDTHILHIFRSDNVPLKVKVSFYILDNKFNKIYYFEEKVDTALEFILHNFDSGYTNQNGSVAVFSYPDCILLKHDENYTYTLSLMNIISNNIIGKHPLFSGGILNLFKQGISCHEFEVESIDSGGVARYWDINIKMISGDRNNRYLISSFYHVTEKVCESELIKRQGKEMQRILDGVSEIINIIDKDGKYTYINQAGREKLSPYIPKYIPEIKAVDSKMAFNSFGEDGLNDINGNKLSFEEIPDQRVLRGETFTNYTIIGTDQELTTYHECDGRPIYDGQGNVEGGVLTYRDIKNDYKVEEYRILQENLKNIPIYYTSFSHKDFKIYFMNNYAFQALKKEHTEVNKLLDIIGKSFFNFYKAVDTNDLINNINKAVENQSSFLHEHKFARDGKIIHTKSVFQPVYDKNNETMRIIALGIDITDEMMANKEMKGILKIQEEIFINTSHELKTPLNLIFSASQLFNYNIVEVIDDIVQSVSSYNQSKGIKIIFDTETEELITALDIYKFNRVLLNLISNAIKFPNIDGLVLIKLVKKDDNTVRISVIDKGIGINQKDLDIIFQKFMQLNKNLNRTSEGTGIGLSLVKSIVELHGGSVSVESTLGKGSTFTIELPVKTIENKSINHIEHDDDDKI